MEQNINVQKPEDMNAAFAKAYNSGDIEALLKLYEPEAILVTQAREELIGLEKIRTELKGLIELNGNMTSRNLSCIIYEDIALLQAYFELKTSQKGGILIQGKTSEVVRKQPDGNWKYIIDRPFS